MKWWTDAHPAIAPRACLTERARAWAFEQVEDRDATVSAVAAQLGVAWWTIMNLDTIVEDPQRLAYVDAIGRTRRRTYAPPGGIRPGSPPGSLINSGAPRPAARRGARPPGTVLGGWLAAPDPDWWARSDTASLAPFRRYATALATQIPDTTRVLDPFHVVNWA